MMMDQQLSPEGLRRRDAILRMANALARRRRSRRILMRTAAAVAVIAVVIRLLPTAERRVQMHLPIASVVSPAVPSVQVEYLQTDSTITDRLTLKPSPPRWTNVGDDELLKDLADAGQPAGIVTLNGKTFLLPAAPMR